MSDAQITIPDSLPLRDRVLAYITTCGDQGCTDSQIETALGIQHSSMVPRRYELVKAGLVEDTGFKARPLGAKRKAKVWRIVRPDPTQAPPSTTPSMFASSGYKDGRAPSVDQETSHDAADAIEGKAPSLRTQIYGYVHHKGRGGATDYEIENALELRHQTASARRRELVIKGMLFDSGRKRLTDSGRKAIVWVSDRAWVGQD